MKRKSVYWKSGLTVFCTVAAILLFYDTVFAKHIVLHGLMRLLAAMRPVIYGAFMAYLLAPCVDFWERLLFAGIVDRAHRKGKMSAPFPRTVSLLLTWVMVAAAVWVLLLVLIPQLYKSVMQLVSNVETYYWTVAGWAETVAEDYPEVENWILYQINTYYEEITDWTDWVRSMLPRAQTLMTLLSGGVWQVIVFFGDFLVGVIVSIYLMATKERSAAHARKMVYAFLPQEYTKWVFRGIHKIDAIFSGFVRGKLLDSLIIGLLCFAGCQLMKIPYTPLVSIFVGVTNVIPFFGPFLGAIPSTFLILLASPIKALYFVIFVLFLQQLDGNIIGPKILGNQTGLSSMWVITAILVGGHFFGLPGMFFGVPVFACIHSFIAFLVCGSLDKKQLPPESAAYRTDIPGESTWEKQGS